jgi:hypothetical protein
MEVGLISSADRVELLDKGAVGEIEGSRTIKTARKSLEKKRLIYRGPLSVIKSRQYDLSFRRNRKSGYCRGNESKIL